MIKIYASQLDRVVDCPGSAQLCASHRDDIPQDFSAAAEGTAMHWIVEMLLKGQISDAKEAVGTKAPNDISITSEHAWYATQAVNCLPEGIGIESETKLKSDLLHTNCVVDAWCVDLGHLFVFDFKFGFGIKEPNSWQLMEYARCLTQDRSEIEHIHLTIIQPRAWHPEGIKRSVSYVRAEFDQMIDDMVVPRVQIALSDNPYFATGTNCTYCTGRHVCIAHLKASANALDMVEAYVDYPLDTDKLSKQLIDLERGNELINARMVAIKAILLDALYKGTSIPDWQLQQGVGHRFWKDESKLRAIAALNGVDVIKESMVTPAEAERRGLSKELTNSLSDKGKTSARLVRSTDAKKVFKP